LLLLISPINTQEAQEAIEGGADIIDVKNPREGSLGASFPWIIKKIREMTPNYIQVSATLGDVPFKPGTVSLAAVGALVSGANYIKVGLFGTKNYNQALDVMKNVVKSVKEYKDDVSVVASGYADAYKVGSINPLKIPKVAAAAGADLAMLDTAIKGGENLFDFMDLESLEIFIEEIHNNGMKAALAGSIKEEHLYTLYELNCDVVGIRGAACINGDRNSGIIHRSAVSSLKNMIENF
jgi:(5-formylfuran-3-yl)methyl phosphate synthase